MVMPAVSQRPLGSANASVAIVRANRALARARKGVPSSSQIRAGTKRLSCPGHHDRPDLVVAVEVMKGVAHLGVHAPGPSVHLFRTVEGHRRNGPVDVNQYRSVLGHVLAPPGRRSRSRNLPTPRPERQRTLPAGSVSKLRHYLPAFNSGIPGGNLVYDRPLVNEASKGSVNLSLWERSDHGECAEHPDRG
jgi:hypothetical protein